MSTSWTSAEFRAMGSGCRVVAPTAEDVTAARAVVQQLERRWSRFRPGSEISRLNAAPGRWTVVSAETFALLERAEHARRRTEGAFEPFLLGRLEDLGYDRPWTGPPDSPLRAPEPTFVRPGPVEVDQSTGAVRLPPGARFDPGGIGKGFAADLVADHLRAAGAAWGQVELGGDVRVFGPAPSGPAWRVRVEGPDGAGYAAEVVIAEGGVATSGTARRSWRRGGRSLHHLIDPATGWPAETDLVAVTATAGSLWWAEVVAKVVLIAGSAAGERILRGLGLGGVLLRRTGERIDVATPVPGDEEHGEDQEVVAA